MTHEESGAQFAAAQHLKTVELQAVAIKAKDDEIARLGIVVADQRATIAGMVAPAAPSLHAAAEEVLKHRHGALPTCGWLRDNDASRKALEGLACALAAPAAPSEQGRNGFVPMPTEINAVVKLGFAYLDAARKDLPNKSWSFSHAGYRAMVAAAAAAPAAPLPDQPEQIQPQQSDRIAKFALGEWFEARTIEEMQAFYMSRLPAIRAAAKEHGYAIGLHGSTRRDFDLMAMQWRADAADKDALAHAIAVAACGITRDGAYEWEAKPNGRFAVSMPICWTDHGNPDFHNKLSIGRIDLSVLEHVPAEPAGQHDAIVAARALLESKWDAEGDCGSCAWHACLYEHGVDDSDIAYALQNNGGILELSCVSKDADDPSSHRGVKIKISPDAAEQAQVPAGTAGCSQADFAGSAPLPELTGPSEPNQPLILDKHGTQRFRENVLVRYLLDNGPISLNDLAEVECSVADREQFAQLIGYSLNGYGELSYVTDERFYAAQSAASPSPAPAPTEAQQTLPHEQAPPNSLPNWGECALRVENSDFTAKRMAEGGYGAEADSKLATQLHRFIFEYDDADSFRSAWFMHRLELTIEEAKRMGGITSKESAEAAAPAKGESK